MDVVDTANVAPMAVQEMLHVPVLARVDGELQLGFLVVAFCRDTPHLDATTHNFLLRTLHLQPMRSGSAILRLRPLFFGDCRAAGAKKVELGHEGKIDNVFPRERGLA